MKFSSTCIRTLSAAGVLFAFVTLPVLAAGGQSSDSIGRKSVLRPYASIPIAWLPCAGEGGSCVVPGTRVMRYGANGQYAYREVEGIATCSTSSFGYDPLPGEYKLCSYESAPRSVNVVALEPLNFPGYKVRHASFQGLISPIGTYSSDADWNSARWTVRRGLSDPACLSFEANDRPRDYLRATPGGRVVLATLDGSTGFNREATFCARAPVAPGDGAISFESKAQPGSYLRHVNFELYVSPSDGTQQSAIDATFYPVNPVKSMSNGAIVNLEAINFPGYRIRHANFQGFVNAINPGSSDLDRADSAWLVRPGLADPTCTSLESTNYPGHFLRHAFYRIVLSPRDTTSVFDQDATFCPRPANSGRLGGQAVSFESYNFPGLYLQHANFELFIGASDGTDAFRNNSTFLPASAR